ncbi:AcrR family transcriptional regulator [Sphingomonas jinjuensis]|uniref:AcrR family transcriptional regulator n=1 Tax=Sphingomonas jinjuensis TaxID=535907 RepID=A0A840FC81_9SPHN|nr:TetR/AcrR family transcriptional regulator [Sphingomonas jinjuensis]MBB4154321.1 AcrR family transcriptional regulator [Sphingomonas jinjuensis]
MASALSLVCPPDRAALRRDRVIAAARKLFEDKGFHSTGIAEIATLSGVKVGQIYRDFASKEEIVAAIVEADFAAFSDASGFRTAIASRNKAGVIAAIDQMFTRVDGKRLMPEIIAEASRNPAVAATIRDLDTRCKGELLEALEVLAPGVDRRHAREIAAEIVLTLIVGTCHRTVARPTPSDCAANQALRTIVARELHKLAGD